MWRVGFFLENVEEVLKHNYVNGIKKRTEKCSKKLINMKERIRMWRVAKSGKIISKKAHLLDIKEYFPRYDLTISILLNFKSWQQEKHLVKLKMHKDPNSAVHVLLSIFYPDFI